MDKLFKNKKVTVLLILLIIIGIVIVLNRTKTLECNKKVSNKVYNETVKVSIEYNKKIKNYYINEKYNYNEGYMDNLIDTFDNKKIYLENLKNIDGVLVNINQKGYQYDYNININLDKIDKSNYSLLKVDKIMELHKLKDIKKHYEELGFSCK